MCVCVCVSQVPCFLVSMSCVRVSVAVVAWIASIRPCRIVSASFVLS